MKKLFTIRTLLPFLLIICLSSCDKDIRDCEILRDSKMSYKIMDEASNIDSTEFRYYMLYKGNRLYLVDHKREIKYNIESADPDKTAGLAFLLIIIFFFIGLTVGLIKNN